MKDLLFRTGPSVFSEGSGVDVDLVLLRTFDLEADYVTLPDGVLGRMLFLPDGSARVEVSRELADEAETDTVARRRLRTTLAHECGHVACHRLLFLGDTEMLSLFPSGEAEEEKPAILCRESTVGAGSGYSGEWWEYQANQCMACLLLPRHLLVPRVETALSGVGATSFQEVVERGRDEEFVRSLANMFDVSWQALLYRLEEFGFIPSQAQMGQGSIELGG